MRGIGENLCAHAFVYVFNKVRSMKANHRLIVMTPPVAPLHTSVKTGSQWCGKSAGCARI